MLVTSRGALRLHPMSIDGPIESFSPFHNINCPKGFLYFNKQVGGAASREGSQQTVCLRRGGDGVSVLRRAS